MKAQLWLVLCLLALLSAGDRALFGCGSWGSITTSGNTDSFPDPASNSDSGFGWQWNYNMSGSNGSFTGHADVTFAWYIPTLQNKDTGVQTATGWTKKTMGSWTSGGVGHHGAPSDAKVTGEGDGTAEATVHMDANNFDFTTGSNAALAYAKITFSGVCPVSAEINLNCTFKEGDTTISGTLSSDPSITITTTVGGDVADAQGVNTCSDTKDFTGNIAGKTQKGYGTCSVRARCNNSAYESSVDASTTISTCSLTKDYGGHGQCPDLCAQHDNH